MSIQQALASHLLNDSGVALLVSNRVYHMIAPRDTASPYITYQRISEDRARHMTAAAGLVAAEFDVNVWADSSGKAIEVAEAVRDSLDHNYNATIGLAPYSATLGAAFLESSLDDWEPPSDASSDGTFRVLQTWTIWHTESIPALAV